MLPRKREAIDLPVESRPPADAEAAAGPYRVRPGVLVVDDEHLVRVLVQLGLERHNFEVWSASNGREAIDLYRKHSDQIAIVLLDVRMPGLDGVQTLDALRGVNPDVMVCFMTGHMGSYEPEELRRHGAAGVIAKPFHLDDLVRVMQLLVQNVSADLLLSGEAYRR